MRCPNCSAPLPITAEQVHYCSGCGRRQTAYKLPDVFPWRIEAKSIGHGRSIICLYHTETIDACAVVATIDDRRILAVKIALSQHLSRHRGQLSPDLITADFSPDRNELIAATGVIYGR